MKFDKLISLSNRNKSDWDRRKKMISCRARRNFYSSCPRPVLQRNKLKNLLNKLDNYGLPLGLINVITRKKVVTVSLPTLVHCEPCYCLFSVNAFTAESLMMECVVCFSGIMYMVHNVEEWKGCFIVSHVCTTRVCINAMVKSKE